MKKNILVALAILGVVASAYSQGQIVLVNNFAGVKAPVFGPQPGDVNTRLSGNGTTGLPAGTTAYTGPLLAGTQYAAQLYGGPVGTAEGSLVAATPSTTFRTGGAAGFINPVTVSLPGVPADANATVQLRVWDTTSGTSWETATIKGQSDLFTVNKLGGGVTTPPNLTDLRSFNITGGATVTPEPSTFALAGLGAAALLIFRRRK